MTSEMVPDWKSSRVATAQAFLRRVGHRDAGEVTELLSEHVIYRVPGHGSLAGTFTGREAVLRHLKELVELTHDTLDEVKWEDWMIGDLYLAALVQVHAQPQGRMYSGRHIYLLGFDVDNRIEEVTVFFGDEDAASRLL
jgi:ketosteroid isomerase-like protein